MKNTITTASGALLPARWSICPRCDGNGHHDHPAFANGISSDDIAECGDEEFVEAYLAGQYDVPCTECKGEGKVLEVDDRRLTPQQQEDYLEHLQNLRDEAIWKAEAEAERRMGA